MGGTKNRCQHPCAGRSDAQRETFEIIAMGERPPYRQQAIQALLNAGLIEKAGDVDGRTVYAVPVHIQHQWWRWCDEHAGEQFAERMSNAE